MQHMKFGKRTSQISQILQKCRILHSLSAVPVTSVSTAYHYVNMALNFSTKIAVRLQEIIFFNEIHERH